MRALRWLKRIALVLVVAAFAFVFGWVPYWFAGLVTTRRFQFPDRENAELTPKSFDLAYEDVSFTSGDGVPLKGWWVPASEARGTVVLVHGLNRSRLEMVKKVPFLAAQGWNALLFDLRNHGESGGRATSFGQHEKDDVRAAIALARGRAAGPVVLWGVSLGAASVTLAAADDSSVAGVVCDSSFRSLRDTVSHHIGLFKQMAREQPSDGAAGGRGRRGGGGFRTFRTIVSIVPRWPLDSEVVFWMGRRGEFDPDTVDVRAAAAKLAGRPCLFVCNTGDRRIPSEIAFELKAAAGDRAEVLVIPGDSHGGAYRDGQAPYEVAVKRVLDEALGTPRPESRAASE